MSDEHDVPAPPQLPQPPPGQPAQGAPVPGLDPLAGPYSPTSEERTQAMLIHLLSLLTGFLGPLILWLVKKDESQFVNHHGKEALNLQITFFIYSIPLMVITIITFGLAGFLYLPLMILFYVLGIIGCIRASEGNWFRIPGIIRLIR